MKVFNDAGMAREEIASTYQTELEQVNATLSNSKYRACHDLCNDYKTLLEKGIQHFSKPLGLMSHPRDRDPDETMAYQIGYKRRELRHCTELKEARLKKTRKRKRKKTRKRKKPVSKSKKRNKSKRKKR